MSDAVVLKVGGELLEHPDHLRNVVSAVSVIRCTSPLIVVHGGGREIDAALASAGIEKRQVDGLRITDEPTLAVVVSVLAGAVNTRFVAALGHTGVPAVGLTGADGSCGLCAVAPPHQSIGGELADLGRVGIPSPDADMSLLETLTTAGYVPVVACIGVDGRGGLLNVNADTLAGHLAARLGARRLVFAGTTAGVLDDGRTVSCIGCEEIADLIARKAATAGMIAKLRASEQAVRSGVEEVVIADGRESASLEAAAAGIVRPGATRIVLESVSHA